MQFNFSETQRFRQWWLIILISLPFLFFSCIAVSQIFFGIIYGDKPMSNAEVTIALLVNTAILVLFFYVRLETRVEQDCIRIRFFPFHFSWRTFPRDEIANAVVREYKPIAEYGGWGIRGIGKNRAFNISGNKGLQLEFNDGKRILIGTQQPEELAIAVRNFMSHQTT
jgi:hypothetical protein